MSPRISVLGGIGAIAASLCIAVVSCSLLATPASANPNPPGLDPETQRIINEIVQEIIDEHDPPWPDPRPLPPPPVGEDMYEQWVIDWLLENGYWF